MFNNLTLNSIFWLVLGIALAGYGAYVGYYWRTYPLSAGLVFLGLGGVFCGITNGFTDYSPMGRLLWKIGLPSLLLGLLLVGYSMLRFI
jgi:hypothetical protein